ncbi:unnamed protein product [Peniophora sp. CBMAI 1063]|nr:unnamed protein product [Peniophora sp. CBMAI 1063]
MMSGMTRSCRQSAHFNQFKFFNIETDSKSGITKMALSQSAVTVFGHLSISAITKGFTKYVYKVCGLAQGPLVAKQFYNIGGNCLSSSENNFANLQLEVQCVQQLGYFLKKFYKYTCLTALM